MENENSLAAKKAFAENGKFCCKTKGISMYPLFKTGRDIIVVEPITSPLKKYDVPAYVREGCESLVLHRIIKESSGDIFVILGDNTYRKEYVKREDIVGVMTGFFRKGKYCCCATSKGYRVYIFFMRLFYPFRWFYKIKILKYRSILFGVLSKIKRRILKSNKTKKI